METETFVAPSPEANFKADAAANPQEVKAPSETKPPIEKEAQKEPVQQQTTESTSFSESIKPKEEVVIEEVQRKDEKPAQFIARLKQERAEAQNQANQFKARVAELEKKSSESPNIDEYEKRIAALNKDLEVSAFERSQKFQNEFKKPLDTAKERAKTFITKYATTNGGAGVFEKAMILQGTERIEYLNENLGTAAHEALSRIAGVEDLEQGIQQALSDHESIKKELQVKQQDNGNESALKAFNGIRGEIETNLQAFKGEQGNKLWEEATAILSGKANPTDTLYAPALAVYAARVAIPEMRRLTAENKTLLDRIARYDSGNPNPQGRGRDEISDTTLTIDPKKGIPSPAEFMKRQMAGAK